MTSSIEIEANAGSVFGSSLSIRQSSGRSICASRARAARVSRLRYDACAILPHPRRARARPRLARVVEVELPKDREPGGADGRLKFDDLLLDRREARLHARVRER